MVGPCGRTGPTEPSRRDSRFRDSHVRVAPAHHALDLPDLLGAPVLLDPGQGRTGPLRGIHRVPAPRKGKCHGRESIPPPGIQRRLPDVSAADSLLQGFPGVDLRVCHLLCGVLDLAVAGELPVADLQVSIHVVSISMWAIRVM